VARAPVPRRPPAGRRAERLPALRLGRLDRRRRQDALLLAAAGLVLWLATTATADFTYRYTLPLYATLPVAAGLALGRAR
jgi:hypothetical protein